MALDGREFGHYVYFLVSCAESDDFVYLKIGQTIDPVSRARAIVQGSPLEPLSFHYVRLWSVESARELEKILLTEFAKWSTRGEWFKFSIEDKTEFNNRRKAVCDLFSRAGWDSSLQALNIFGIVRKRRRTLGILSGLNSLTVKMARVVTNKPDIDVSLEKQ
jgi:hypothetical protein